MPIEIRELIIKSTVDKEPPGSLSINFRKEEVEQLKSEILKNSDQLIRKIMKDQHRR